jgi:hypothetical protein
VDDMARGVATAALTLQSVLLQTMAADGTLTPARALEICDRAIAATRARPQRTRKGPWRR